MDLGDHLDVERRCAPWDAHFHRAVELGSGALGFLALSALAPSDGLQAGAAVSGGLALTSLAAAVRRFRVAHGRWPRLGRIDT